MSTTSQIILVVIDEHGGEVEGTETLALAANVRRKSYLLKCVRALRHNSLITIIPSSGGRGRKTIYRRRNRNQPGQPRRR